MLNWIHIDDQVEIIEFLLNHEDANGIINSVSPDIKTNKQWAQSFATALNRPCVMFIPGFVMNTVYG